MDPKNDVDRSRLSRAIEQSYRDLEPFRTSRRELIEDYVGNRYGNGEGIRGRRLTIYVNLMQTVAEAYRVSLSYNEPRFCVSTWKTEYRSFADRFSTALNSYASKIHLGETIRELINDAIFQIGISKIYLKDSGYLSMDGDVWSDPGMPFVSRVSLDNWVHDVTKSDFRHAQFMCDRYEMDYDAAKSCTWFDAGVRDRLQPTRLTDRSSRIDAVSTLATQSTHNNQQIEDVVLLADVFLPKEKLICTYPVRERMQLADYPLACTPWTGPDTGPYRFLSFIDVPDNIMPTSPAQSLRDLFYLYNFLMRKIARRAQQERTIGTYTSRAVKDMNRAMTAEDMEYICCDNPQDIGTIKIPGPDQGLVSFTYGLEQLFKQSAGNIDALLGLGTTANTAAQSNLIDQKVGMKMAESRRRVNRFVSELASDVGEMLWTDPAQVIPGERNVPGTDMPIDATWLPPHPDDPTRRKGAKADYELFVEPYSMEFQSPQEHLQDIRGYVELTASVAPLLQQSGWQFDPTEWFNAEAKYGNDEIYKMLWKTGPPPAMALPGGPPQADQGMAPQQQAAGPGSGAGQGPSANGMMTQAFQQQPQSEPQLM